MTDEKHKFKKASLEYKRKIKNLENEIEEIKTDNKRY